MKNKIMSLVLVILLSILLVSCGEKFNVTFDLNGGSSSVEINNEVIKKGNKVSKPKDPEKAGYIFVGWYLNEEEFDFNTKVTTDLKIVARWHKEIVVKFYLDDEEKELYKTEVALRGERIEKPLDPTNENYIFGGWYIDEKEFDFNTRLTKNLNLKALWKEEEIDLTKLKYSEYLNENNPVVKINIRDYGTLELQLFSSVAENTVNNFIDYILNNAYDGSTFHRIIKGFMIQGGQVNKTNDPIKGDFASNGFENNLKHYRGVLSMARTMFPNSATSQFFIMHNDSHHLDGEYASFGGLVKGFHILDKIANVRTDFQDAPLEIIVIESVTIDLKGYEPKEVVYYK